MLLQTQLRLIINDLRLSANEIIGTSHLYTKLEGYSTVLRGFSSHRAQWEQIGANLHGSSSGHLYPDKMFRGSATNGLKWKDDSFPFRRIVTHGL